MKKRKSHAFGKDIYLLGADEEGILYWLEAPSWDCKWYWGFGYIETYTYNADPSRSLDKASHQHATNFIDLWNDFDINTPLLVETTFTQSEGWELSELFKRFYMFRDLAEYYYSGGAGIADSHRLGNVKNLDEWERINRRILPEIMNRIIEILTP